MSRRKKKDGLANVAAKLAKPKKTRWEKAADRQNARLARDNPLFVHAGVQPLTTAAGQQARVEKIVTDFDARIAASEAENAADAAGLRAQIAARVTPDELERLDRQRDDYPKTAVYAVEHWRKALAKLEEPEAAEALVVATSRSVEPLAAPSRPAIQLVLGEAPPPDPEEGVAPIEARVLPPCGECGWSSGSGTYHPGDCPALRALQYRLGRCADCKASPMGGCAAHIAEVKAIDAGELEEPPEFPRRGGR